MQKGAGRPANPSLIQGAVAPPLAALLLLRLRGGCALPTRVDDTLYMAEALKPKNANKDTITISAGPRLKAALVLAILADVAQIAVLPYVIEGYASPADDLLDLCIGGILTLLLGWHWEFLPSFAAKLIPGVDMVPLWTLAVANVYRKTRPRAVATEDGSEQRPSGS